ARFTISSLKVGSHSISATYNGDSHFAKSISASLMQQVTAAAAAFLQAGQPSAASTSLTLAATNLTTFSFAAHIVYGTCQGWGSIVENRQQGSEIPSASSVEEEGGDA